MLNLNNRQYERAEMLLTDVLELSESTYGQFYMWKNETLEMLVRLYIYRREWTLAKDLWTPVVSALRSGIGTAHPGFQKAASLLKRIHCTIGRDDAGNEGLVEGLSDRYWTEECHEIITLSLFKKHEDAYRHVKMCGLKRLVKDGSERWVELEASILHGGVHGVNGKYGLLHLFCETRCEAAVRLLLDLDNRPANTDGKDSDGRTAMHIAAVNGYMSVVELLIAKKASTDVKNIRGETPVILAAKFNHPRLLQMLADNGSDLEAKDNFGYTALHRAVFARAVVAVKTLIANGARVDATRGTHGGTALHCAAIKGYDELVELLLKEGSDASAIDENGRIPRALAGKGKTVEIFEAYTGARPRQAPKRLVRRGWNTGVGTAM
jgi:Ankyrin repeats (3 copies)